MDSADRRQRRRWLPYAVIGLVVAATGAAGYLAADLVDRNRTPGQRGKR